MTRARFLFVVLALALLALIAFKPQRRPSADTSSANQGPEPAGLASKPIHALRHRDFGGGDEWLVRNLVAGAIEVRCSVTSADNVESDPPLPRRLVLASQEEQKLTELRSLDQEKYSHAAIECSAVVGDPRTSPAENVRYALPFYPGTAVNLDQGFNGEYSHHDAQSRYALDFAVAEGTPVLAARDGVVMQVEEDFLATGRDLERYGGRANYIRVAHDDGSMAVYAHLAPHSSLFRPGERVHAGNFLAKSGNTGFSTGPHLHFAVQKNAGLALRSIPFAMTGVVPN